MLQARWSALLGLAMAVLVGVSAPMQGLLAQTPPPAAENPKAAEPEAGPWRLDEALGTPEWLTLSGEIRVRYEGISGQFRSASRLKSVDHLVFTRTILRADMNFDPVGVTLEGMDSRQFGAGSGSFLDTGAVNTVELLQAYLSFNLGELGSGTHSAKLGRQTLDLGSRRLTARNGYRNTPNGFLGAHWKWQPEDMTLEAFYFLPMVRTPSAFDDLVDNDIDVDEHDFDLQFFGAFATFDLGEKQKLETYGFGLLEDGGTQRELGTLGARWLRPAAKEMIDWQVEGVVQFGESRASPTGADLDHLAGYLHASLGYTFDAPWKPRVRVAFDYASGDGESTDGDNNRFDTLFGARRFDYGPTGIYGPFARANIISPELRGEAKPLDELMLMLAWRPVWLASDEDAWTAAGVRDASGNSDSFVGHQIEVMARYDILPKSLDFEVGGAYLFAGDFPEEAPGGRDRDTAYAYAQLTWKF